MENAHAEDTKGVTANSPQVVVKSYRVVRRPTTQSHRDPAGNMEQGTKEANLGTPKGPRGLEEGKGTSPRDPERPEEEGYGSRCPAHNQPEGSPEVVGREPSDKGSRHAPSQHKEVPAGTQGLVHHSNPTDSRSTAEKVRIEPQGKEPGRNPTNGGHMTNRR